MRIALIALALTGCAGLNNNMMTAEQLSAAAKDKNASAVCAVGTGPWGKVVTVYVNVDKASLKAGQVTVDSDCKVTLTDIPPAATKGTQ